MTRGCLRHCAHLLDDPYLAPYADAIRGRAAHAEARALELMGGKGRLADWASAHEYYGLHRTAKGWVFREWAPNATEMWLVGDFSEWRLLPRFQLHRIPGTDVWEQVFPARAIRHLQFYRLEVHWREGRGERIPAYARRVVQDPATNLFCAQVWQPPKPYVWKHSAPRTRKPPRIYEAHVGMASEEGKVASYAEFRDNILPRIRKAGYTVVQLMAVMEHPYGMGVDQHGLEIERGIAIHKMARLATLALARNAYRNFMGNEFGHPEWIDFPRAENGWNYDHARRQWSLRDDPKLRFKALGDFDEAMLGLVRSEGEPVQLCANDGDKVLAFWRDGLVYVFNFNANKSFTDYGIMVPPGRRFRLVLDTDEVRFGGQGRIKPRQVFTPEPVVKDNERVDYVRLYLPARTALVLARQRRGKVCPCTP